MRRVLHVMASGARGGGAGHLAGLLPVLREQGMDVHALVGDDGPLATQLQARGIPVSTRPLTGARGDHRWLGWLEAALGQVRPDLVHYHGTRAGFWGGVLRLVRVDQRSIYTAHGLATRVMRAKPLQKLFFWAETVACRADAVISVSRADLDDLINGHRLPPGRAHHIGNAVAKSPRKNKAGARRRLGLPPRTPVVGCVARLVPQKAVGDLCDAMQCVPGALLAVIGDGPQLQALARHPLVQAKRAYLFGARDDVSECLAAFDVFALSSLWEGEPIALLEAMSGGLPCVATNTPGAAELLGRQEAGLLVAPGDKAALGAAIHRLLGDAALRRRLSTRARAVADSRSYDHAAARTMAVYAQVLGDAALATRASGFERAAPAEQERSA